MSKIKTLVVSVVALSAASSAFAQSSSTTSPPATPSAPSVTAPSGIVMNDDQAKTWIDKVVYSSDNKNIGEVASIERDTSGRVTGLLADIGGVLGIGETRVRVMPSQFRFDGDKVMLTMTSDEASKLPKVTK